MVIYLIHDYTHDTTLKLTQYELKKNEYLVGTAVCINLLSMALPH